MPYALQWLHEHSRREGRREGHLPLFGGTFLSIILHAAVLLFFTSSATMREAAPGAMETGVESASGQTDGVQVEFFQLPKKTSPAATTIQLTPEPTADSPSEPQAVVEEKSDRDAEALVDAQAAGGENLARPPPLGIPDGDSGQTNSDHTEASNTGTNLFSTDLWKAIEPCWRRLGGKAERVTLRVTFTPMGNVDSTPVVISTTGVTGTPLTPAEEIATAALRQCGPYLMAYNQRDIDVSFPPE